MIGPGRAIAAAPDGRRSAVGGASGSLANAALRQHARPGDARAIKAALRRVADGLGVTVARLRLYDYDIACRGDDALPSIAVILATFGTWKAPRRSADGHVSAE